MTPSYNMDNFIGFIRPCKSQTEYILWHNKLCPSVLQGLEIKIGLTLHVLMMSFQSGGLKLSVLIICSFTRMKIFDFIMEYAGIWLFEEVHSVKLRNVACCFLL